MRNWQRVLAAVLTSILASVGVLALVAEPASANAPCYSGYVCIYEHVGYNGSEYDIWAGGNRHTCVSFGFGFWWDRASSIQNNSGTDVNFYTNAYCGGSSLWMFNGMNIGDLGAWGKNDSLDSVWIN